MAVLAAEKKVKPFYEVSSDGTKLIINMEKHMGQARAWLSKKRFIAMIAGSQGGKTAFGVQWLRREIELKGPGDYLVVTATYPLLNLKLLPEFLNVFERLMKLGSYKEKDKTFYYESGDTRIIFVTATNPEGLESATAKGAWLDEAGQDQFKRQAWEAVLRRVALHRGRVLITTTPYNLGWLKQEIYDRWAAGDEEIDVIQFDSLSNPAYPEDVYERARDTMPAWKFDMFYRGRFTRPAGLIYDCFDDTECVVERFPLNNSKYLVFVGHDFGMANTAALFYAQDTATGLFYLFHTYKPGSGRSVAEHVEQFRQITQGMNVIKRAGGSHQEDEIRQAYASHGWPVVEPKVKDTQEQIQRVYAMHRLNKIFVFRDQHDYLDEKLRYSYKLTDDYNIVDEIDNRQMFHLMDAERYILCNIAYEAQGYGRIRTLSLMEMR